jgi:murein DD-endopeptidase MepM/ murein hydrolase activator NlpD
MNKKYVVMAAFYAVILVMLGLTVKKLFDPANVGANAEVNVDYSSTVLKTESVQTSIYQVNRLLPLIVNPQQTDKKPEIVTYTVKQGDTLESIASNYSVSIATISQSNGISESDVLKEGKTLEFPSVKGVLHKVNSGENLWDISSTYNVDISDITNINNLDSPDKLKIGQKIIIPGVDAVKIVKADNKPEIANNAKPTNSLNIASRGGTSASSKPVIQKKQSFDSMWPLRGTITSAYGPRWGAFHEGIDIAAPTGTNIVAFMSGRVVFSGWNSGGYGNLVIIDHGNGLQSYYGHNSKLIVKEGQVVSKGQHISDVGSTGDATGPHCHFEIRKNGEHVNPMNYLN